MEMEELPKKPFHPQSENQDNNTDNNNEDLPQTDFVPEKNTQNNVSQRVDSPDNNNHNDIDNNNSTKSNELRIDIESQTEPTTEKTTLEKTTKAVKYVVPTVKKLVNDQILYKGSAFHIHVREFTREFSLWTSLIVANLILSFVSWGQDEGTGASALSGIFGLVFAATQFLSLVHMFSLKSKFVLLKHTGSAAQKSDLKAPKLLEVLPLFVIGGLLIAFQVVHNVVVTIVFPITILQVLVVMLAIFFRVVFPTVMMEREQAIFPNWPQGSLRYRQMVGPEYFDPSLVASGSDRPVEQGRGYFKKERTRCGCLVATDEIQITTDRITLVSTYKGNIWNCCKPDHQVFTDAWLSKAPGLKVTEPAVICCCLSYVEPLSPVSAVKCCCCSTFQAMDELGMYTHTPCTPSRHLVVASEGVGLWMKVAIDPKDEQIIVNTFYEATQKYNQIAEEDGSENYVVPKPQIMIGFPPNKYQSEHYKKKQ